METNPATNVVATEQLANKPNANAPHPAFFTFAELANRWRCSRATVYNRLRDAGVQVVDFRKRGKRGKRIIPAAVVFQIEAECLKKLM